MATGLGEEMSFQALMLQRQKKTKETVLNDACRLQHLADFSLAFNEVSVRPTHF